MFILGWPPLFLILVSHVICIMDNYRLDIAALCLILTDYMILNDIILAILILFYDNYLLFIQLLTWLYSVICHILAYVF